MKIYIILIHEIPFVHDIMDKVDLTERGSKVYVKFRTIKMESHDESEDNLNIMYWNDLIVLDIGKKNYLMDDFLEIRSSSEITTPLVGLYVINDERLLILEEAFVRVINNKGEVVKSELIDLIEDFSIKDNLLFIQTSEENRIIELN